MQFSQRPVLFALNLQNVLQRAGNEEELLGQPQLLALKAFVVRIKNLGNILRGNLVCHRSEKVTRVEGSKVERLHGLSRPQAHCVCRVCPIPKDRRVVWYSAHHSLRNPQHPDAPVGIGMPFRSAAHLHFECIFGPLKRPRIAKAQPFVCRLHLPAVANLLVEDSILVANTIPDRGHIERG